MRDVQMYPADANALLFRNTSVAVSYRAKTQNLCTCLKIFPKVCLKLQEISSILPLEIQHMSGRIPAGGRIKGRFQGRDVQK